MDFSQQIMLEGFEFSVQLQSRQKYQEAWNPSNQELFERCVHCLSLPYAYFWQQRL